MKCRISICLIVVALVLPVTGQAARETVPGADVMRVHLARRPELDVMTWKDPVRGKAVQVRVLDVNEKFVRVQKTAAAGMLERNIPLSDLAGLTFVLTPLEERMIREPSAEAVAGLRVMWTARKAALGMQGAQVGEVGLALAKGLRDSRVPAAFDEAGVLLDDLLRKEVEELRKQAVREELQTLAMTRALVVGPPEETDRVAWKVTEAGEPAEAMLMATAWLADRHFADLKRVEEDHPRWEEDDEIRPLRMRLYHLSLDFALYPGLFHGGMREEAANGLKKAWQVHRYTGNTQLALHVLEDLATLYPDSQAAKETAGELARAKTRAASVPEEKAALEAEEAADEEDAQGLPKIPPPPKRYNLFDD